MKNLIAALALVLGSTSAFAASAEFTRVTLQPGGYLAQNRIAGGQIVVDTENNAITLVAQPAFFCPPGSLCPMIMPAPLRLMVPLKSISTGACGETIYSGSQDLRMVDGSLQSIVVVSNKTNFCKTLVALPPTTVNYHLETLRGLVEDDAFVATSLQ